MGKTIATWEMIEQAVIKPTSQYLQRRIIKEVTRLKILDHIPDRYQIVWQGRDFYIERQSDIDPWSLTCSRVDIGILQTPGELPSLIEQYFDLEVKARKIRQYIARLNNKANAPVDIAFALPDSCRKYVLGVQGTPSQDLRNEEIMQLIDELVVAKLLY